MSGRAAWRLETLGFLDVYRYTAGKTDWLAADLPTEGEQASEPRISVAADRDPPSCRPGERVADVRRRLQLSADDVCLVLNDERIVLGLLRCASLERTSPDAV